jgi:SSS family solute:Na+ symporter
MAWILGSVGADLLHPVHRSGHRFQSQQPRRPIVGVHVRAPLPAARFALAFVGVAARYLYTDPGQPSLFALPVFIEKMSAPLAAMVSVSLIASVLVSVSTVALATTALVMRDFYVPWRKPDADQEMIATRYVSLAVGLAPLLFVFFTPHILELSFFTRALRLSIAIVALIGVYLPFVGSPRGAVTGLVASGLATTAWYLLKNPFGVDNIYVAAVVPAVVLAIDRLVSGRRSVALAADGKASS